MYCRTVHQIVDLLVRFLRRYRNRANDTIARFALVSGSQASSIIKLKMSPHIPPELSHAIVFFISAANFVVHIFQPCQGDTM